MMRWLFFGSIGETLFSAIVGIFSPLTQTARTSSAYHTQPDGVLVLCYAGERRVKNARRIDRVDGIDYGYNALGVDYVATDDVGGSLPGPFPLLLEPNVTNVTSTLSYQSASGMLIEDTVDGTHGAYSSHALSGVHTMLAVVKNTSTRNIQLRPRLIGSGIAVANFDIQTGVVSQSSGSGLVSTHIEKIGDYSFCYMTLNYPGGSAQVNLIDSLTAAENGAYQGDGVSGVELVGLMHCLGEYRGSYTSNTRTADNPVTIPNISATDSPLITYINDSGLAITEDAKTSSICAYNSGTEDLTIGNDTSKIRLPVKVNQ